jgi:hypothetical protein
MDEIVRFIPTKAQSEVGDTQPWDLVSHTHIRRLFLQFSFIITQKNIPLGADRKLPL